VKVKSYNLTQKKIKDKMTDRGFDPEKHINLAHCFTKKFISKNPTFAYIEEDLTAASLEALVRASKKYNPEKGAISTFYWHHFCTARKKCLVHSTSAVSSPENKDFVPCKTWEGEIGREANTITAREFDPARLIDLQEVLKTLPKRTIFILSLKYGLFGNKAHTNDEIGKTIGCKRKHPTDYNKSYC